MGGNGNAREEAATPPAPLRLQKLYFSDVCSVIIRRREAESNKI
jgi:hypothetical protein